MKNIKYAAHIIAPSSAFLTTLKWTSIFAQTITSPLCLSYNVYIAPYASKTKSTSHTPTTPYKKRI